MNELEIGSEEKFNAFKERLEKYGFREVEQREKREYQHVKGLVAPKNRRYHSGQVSFVYTHMSGMKTLVWTTEKPDRNSVIELGLSMGWVLILSKDGKSLYISPPVKRVGEFWNRLSLRAIACQMRVAHRPVCKCGEYMEVDRNDRAFGARFWRCGRVQNHINEKLPTKNWDYGISGKYLNFVKKERKTRKTYRKKRRKEGKDPNIATKTRKPWISKDR